MAIVDIKRIQIPENQIVIIMSYKQFKSFLKDEGIWNETRIYRTPDGCLYAFSEGHTLIYQSEPRARNG